MLTTIQLLDNRVDGGKLGREVKKVERVENVSLDPPNYVVFNTLQPTTEGHSEVNCKR